MAASAAAAATTFQRTPTLHLNLTPNRLTPYSKLSSVSLQRSRQPWPTQFPLRSSSSSSSSSSISFSHNLPRLPLGFFFCSASSDETLVTDDEKDVVTDESESQPQPEETEDDDSIDDNVTEESPASILASLQSYKEAIADNNESKLSEIEAHLKSVEDEKLFLERQLATLSEELSSAKDRVLRISADFDNFRKRTDRERVSLVANTQGEVVESLLPVLDNFERAKSQIKVETEKEEKINNSYQSIYKQFVEVLDSLGVVPVETTGEPFDPLLHEAIMREESTEYDEGVVIQEFRKGFRLGERLLRPSMVKVSAGPGPGNDAPVTASEPESSEDVAEEQSEASSADDE